MGSARASLARPTVPFAASALVASGALLLPATAQEVPLDRVHAMLPPTAFNARVSGDWDGDGDVDLATASPLTWLENIDQGRLELRTIPVQANEDFLLSGDFDDDGRADLVSSGTYPRGLRVWLNPASPPFSTPPATLSLGSSNAYSLESAHGDLDGDGDIDLYAFGTTGFPSTPETLFLNDGSGGFSAGGSAPPRQSTLAVTLADFDGDGDLDALRGAYASATELWSNDGSGTFALAVQQPPVQVGVSQFFTRAADVNVDGRVDFLAGETPHLYLASGDARFVDEGPVLPGMDTSRSREFFLVDVTGDDRPDVLGVPARGFGSSGAALFRNTGHLPFELDSATQVPFSIAVVADVDADLDRDVVGSAGDAELWLNDGKGRFENTRDPWESYLRTAVVAAGDLDGEGFADIFSWRVAATAQTGLQAVLYRSLGNGAFVEETLPFFLPGYPRRASLGDVDLDGDLDVYALSAMSGIGVPVLLENDGAAEFTQAAGRFPNLAPTYSSGPMDLDLDGDLDLLAIELSTAGPRTPTVLEGYSWLNDGSGLFVDSGKILPSKSYSTFYGGGDPVLGDVDGDMDSDALLLNLSLLWSNDGTGGFTDVSSQLNGSRVFSNGAFADMDRDGDLDFVSSYTWCLDGDCEGEGLVLLNDGVGTFSEAQGYWNSFDPYRGQGRFSLADVEGDGDLDVLGANCMLWQNDGTGRLENESYELSYCLSRYGGYYGTSYEELAIADLDRDGDVDLWYPGLPRPVLSTLRHVSWRSYPRAGKPLTMEVFGPAGTPFQLFASEGFIEPQVADMGFLRLAARGARLVATGTLDAEGKAAFTLGVPSDLALPENTIYWQALVGSPPRLTNLELTTFSNL